MTNMTKRLLSLAIAVIMMISLLPVSVFAETPAELPQAEVTKLPAMTLAGGEYMTWPNGDDTIDRPLEIVVNFKAMEEDAGAYKDWKVDFYLTVSGLANGAITADNCYLAGNYGSFGWIVIPTDGVVLEEGVTNPIVSAHDANLTYKEICTSVKDFTAAIHIDEAILNANPDMEVCLELKMTDPENGENVMQVGEDMIYNVGQLKGLPQAEVTKLPAMTLAGGEYKIFDDSLREGVEELPLNAVVNFKAMDTLEECLAGGYAQWLVDFNITFEGLENGSFVADNCYLAGSYGEFGWIAIPTDGMLLQENVVYPVVANYDADLNYKDICKSVQDFTAALYVDQAVLDANPNMTVKLELVMTNPNNKEETLQIGEDIIYTAQQLRSAPNAKVTPMAKVELEAGEYDVWNGSSLSAGTAKLPLEVVLNFKAIDTLEECLAGGYAKWLVDFNITFEGLENGSFVADNCYLAGNYGTFRWIKVPTDGITLENGVTYPVVSQYDATLNYKDICKSVQDFTAAIHIDQAVLDANPNMTVKLELVMTNPNNKEEKIQIGPDYIYGVAALKNSVAAMNKDTNEIYSNVEDAMKEAVSGQTVKLLGDINDEEISVKKDVVLDLNGYDLSATSVAAVFGSAAIIDSTDGKALLKIEKDALAVQSNNEYLPVWVEEDGVSGYRFTKVSLRQSVKVLVNGDAYFRFYIEGDDANCELQKALADGGADNDIYLKVQLNWVDINGNSASRLFTYNEEQLIKYAQNWTGNEFRLTVTGMENVSELHLTGMVVSVPVESANVTIYGDTKTVSK
ncbi:MAG: hypothetical protein IKU07_04655 [Oscillospiraceae bacterium]|nr:hypothetical protein [Oscillospiraceae bacterium]